MFSDTKKKKSPFKHGEAISNLFQLILKSCEVLERESIYPNWSTTAALSLRHLELTKKTLRVQTSNWVYRIKENNWKQHVESEFIWSCCLFDKLISVISLHSYSPHYHHCIHLSDCSLLILHLKTQYHSIISSETSPTFNFFTHFSVCLVRGGFLPLVRRVHVVRGTALYFVWLSWEQGK